MSLASPSQDWLHEQRFPKPDRSYRDAVTLLYLQSYDASDVRCHVRCGEHTLKMDEKLFSIWFTMNPSPLQSDFQLELRFQPTPIGQTKSLKYIRDRMSVTFATYDSSGERFADRFPHKYAGSGVNPAPTGPLNFSQQLYDVRCRSRSSITDSSLPLWPDIEPDLQVCYAWRTKKCIRTSFSRSLEDASPEATRAVETFEKLLNHAVTTQDRIEIVTRRNTNMTKTVWPWFASMPAPTPPSYFPWLNDMQPGSDMQKIMDFTSRNGCELDTAYVDKAFAIRPRGWYLDVKDGRSVIPQKCTTIPQPLTLDPLPAVIRFRDEREYVAHILGNHAYENAHSNKITFLHCNGDHVCDVFPDEQGSRTHVVLLNIRPPPSEQSGEALAAQETAGLPEMGERVLIQIMLDSNIGDEEWHGKVVRIPGKYQKYGWNVAIEAVRPPSGGGRILANRRLIAYFYFGHSGTPAGPLRQTIIEKMMDPNEKPWWRDLLLARDNLNIPENVEEGGLPHGWRDLFARDIFGPRSLNQEQRDAIIHFYSHRFTMVVGPPGTGKSTLVDAILQIEEKLGSKFWVCTDSNAAVDVLAKKFTDRRKDKQPEKYFRIKPMFDEHLPDKTDRGSLIDTEGVTTLPGYSHPAAGVVSGHIRKQDTESIRLMSLGHTIHKRLQQCADGKINKANLRWRSELDDLKALQTARDNVTRIRFEDARPAEDIIKEEQKMRKEELGKLRKLQRGYVNSASGIFSTTSATSSPLLAHFAPRTIIMDEASQFGEAKAVHSILHAVRNGSLRRVLLIGDHHQLPPTVLAVRNIFRNTGQLSLFERLIEAGTPYQHLLEQFRSHPSISSIYNTLFYHDALRDGAITSSRAESRQFMTFIKQLARVNGEANFPDSCSAIISPVRSNNYRWGSERRPGSTSVLNYQTAAMICQLSERLIRKGGFKAQDILVTAFYADQVMVLKALFQDESFFDGLRVMTVDGSQGEEALIQIIDCVTLGAGSGDKLGFLSREKRRFNVAMSRGRAGRIVISHADMVNMPSINVKNVWSRFHKQAKEQPRTIFRGGSLNDGWPVDMPRLLDRFNDVRNAFGSDKTSALTARIAEVQNRNNQVAISKARQTIYGYNTMAFIEVTGASDAQATRYITTAQNELHIAINNYLTEHGNDLGEAEEVGARTAIIRLGP